MLNKNNLPNKITDFLHHGYSQIWVLEISAHFVIVTPSLKVVISPYKTHIPWINDHHMYRMFSVC